MKVAIVHDFLCQFGGAERFLEVVHNIFPDAPIYVLYYRPEALPTEWRKWDIRPSSLVKKLPFKKKFFRHYLPIYPLAIEQFDLTSYDLVISSSYLWAHSVITPPHTCHISYCHTPMRQAWDLYFEYYKTYAKPGLRFLYKLILHYMRLYDTVTADRVDYFVANSHYVQSRIRKYYRRESEVIYPPVDVEKFEISDKIDDYYVCFSRLVPYKRVNLAVEAFNKLGKKLLVIGRGPELKRIKSIAKSNIEILGWLPDTELRKYLSHAKAFIFPSIEDFGMVVVEAQACGRPVIVSRIGGAKEAIIEGTTGLVFDEQSPEAIIDAVNRLERLEFDPQKIRQNAFRFDKKVFDNVFRKFIFDKLKEFGKDVGNKEVR